MIYDIGSHGKRNSRVELYKNSLGQSDAEISLVQTKSRGLCIRKSVQEEHSASLYKQYEKHERALKHDLMSPIGIPRIFGGFATREYMMDYIPGIAIGEFIESCDAEELRVIQDQVLNYLERTSRDSQQDLETDILLEFVENKLNRCLVSLSGNWLAKKLQIQKDALILSYGERKYGKRWSHGDFSFENLLVSQSLTVSAIDFLESEISIIEIDWGRIWLDLKFGWWAYSNHRTTNGEINRAKFESSLEGKAKELGLPRRELNKFALLAALRVLPYSRRPLRRGHIAFTINNLIDSILK